MSAAELRQAAALMRERAEAATPGPWWDDSGVSGGFVVMCPHHRVALCADRYGPGREDATHIASWHPAVALAVADWLENAAEDLAMQGPNGELRKNWDMRVHIAGDKALAVARAYLGSAS